jgi:hypothetical protein
LGVVNADDKRTFPLRADFMFTLVKGFAVPRTGQGGF